ncbi:ubiquitin interaction domain-containing protein [Diaporthe helianthi]|uniref:Ubiquitin interaction domain-containing protein n=1 Tax=Diaporthe helianthi TaxID=158607 RepID=A0A2P5HWV6_DIAHE|nr:ubiquitin interaction domain-containing protein [Diaporthe helianthi]
MELNGCDDEDEALRRAIAMSLGESMSATAPTTDDDAHGSANINDKGLGLGHAQDEADTQSFSAGGSLALGMLGIERKKMEEERLARLKKRKAGPANLDSPSNDGRNSDLPPAQRPRRMSGQPNLPGYSTGSPGMSQPALPSAISSLNSNSNSSKGVPEAGLSYAQGTVRRTWALGFARRDDDITIEDVLQRDSLELAVLSSFQWDEEWLMKKLDLRKTKVLLIAYAPDENTKATMRNNVPQDVIRFCFPTMMGHGCMHSKLMLLKYPKCLRIVVPTGNLVPYDWGETGVMENMAFLIDLPRIDDPARVAANALTHFGAELQFFLEHQGVDGKMVQSLRNYDFSETSRYGFIHTIGGSHPNVDTWARTGYCGLGSTVKTLGLGSDKPVEVDYVSSSIGAVSNDLMAALYNACKGDSGMMEYDARTGRQKKNKGASPGFNQPDFKEHMRVYFPSRDTVRTSRGGMNSAGTICFQPRWWDSESFPREVLRDFKNVRAGLLSHSKLFFVRRPASGDEEVRSGWAYLGSHNLSESAWGRLVKDRKTGQPKLNCRNWEAGVLIPVTTPRPTPTGDSKTGGTPTERPDEGESMLDVFQGAVPIPLQLPGTPYWNGHEATIRPWFHQDN